MTEIEKGKGTEKETVPETRTGGGVIRETGAGTRSGEPVFPHLYSEFNNSPLILGGKTQGHPVLPHFSAFKDCLPVWHPAEISPSHLTTPTFIAYTKHVLQMLLLTQELY